MYIYTCILPGIRHVHVDTHVLSMDIYCFFQTGVDLEAALPTEDVALPGSKHDTHTQTH